MPINYGGGFSPAPLITQVTIDSGKTEAKEYLQGLATAPHLAAIATTTEVLLGTPAYEILAAAERRDIDLIVLCSHGRTGLTHWVLGSVASTLVRESAVPTLVLREQDPSWRFPDPDRGRPFCALVPLDGSELAEAALTPAAHLIAALAAPELATLHLVQIVPFSQEEAENKAYATRYLTQVAERLRTTARDLRLTISWSVISDRDVASALVSLAEQGRVEVLSTLPYGLSRWASQAALADASMCDGGIFVQCGRTKTKDVEGVCPHFSVSDKQCHSKGSCSNRSRAVQPPSRKRA